MKTESSFDAKRAIIEELVRGRELANHLLQLVSHKSNMGDEESLLIICPYAEDLVKRILRSFTDTLLLFNTNYDSHDVSIKDSSSAWDFREKSVDQDSDRSCRSLSKRDQRGCYKRKRTIEAWEKDSPILIDDGYAWRKYGQKMTLNAKYLRNYYRCSHKDDERCLAMKQVQRIQEKPPIYRTTYFGLHTCKSKLLSEMTLDRSSPSDSSILLSFNNANNLPSKQDSHPFFSSSSTEKEDHDQEEIPHENVDVEQNQVSQYEHVTLLSSTLDLFSSVKFGSYHEVDDVLFRCFDFDDFVRFGL